MPGASEVKETEIAGVASQPNMVEDNSRVAVGLKLYILVSRTSKKNLGERVALCLCLVLQVDF